MSERVERYYDADPMREWERLERHRTEAALTMRALGRHLPPLVRILDIGGGPGRYAIALAGQGHKVTLLDLSAANLDLARRKAAEQGVELAGIVHGNALDLGDLSGFDAVLLLGPLYHLLEEAERRRCLAEARRVLKPGGLLFASVITRYAPLRDMAASDPARLEREAEKVRQFLSTGQCRAGEGSAFTDFFGFRPADLIPWMESQGLQTLEVLGLEGMVSLIEERVNQLGGPAWESWVALNEEAGRDPSLWGQCQHLLYVGRMEERVPS